MSTTELVAAGLTDGIPPGIRAPPKAAAIQELDRRLTGAIGGIRGDRARLFDTYATHLLQWLRGRHGSALGVEAEDLQQNPFFYFFKDHGRCSQGRVSRSTPLPIEPACAAGAEGSRPQLALSQERAAAHRSP